MVLKIWIKILWTIIYFSEAILREISVYVCIIFSAVGMVSNATIDLTATPYLQTFDSHDTFGTSNYPDGNYTRDWLITGETANYTITIEFLQCALETGNNKGVCIKDEVYLYDGSNSSASLLQVTCCGNAHVATVQSTGGTMYIIFVTDDTVTDVGFRISYILEGAPTTTEAATTVVFAAAAQEKDNTIYIIIACAVTGFLLIVIIILICVICCKKKSKNRPKQRILKKSNQQPVVVTSEASSEVELDNESRIQQVLTVQTVHTTSPPPAYAAVVNEQTSAKGNTNDQFKSTKATTKNNTTISTNSDKTASNKDESKRQHKDIIHKTEIKEVTVIPNAKIKDNPTVGKSDNKKSTKEQKHNQTTTIPLQSLNTTSIEEPISETKTVNTTSVKSNPTDSSSGNTIKKHSSEKSAIQNKLEKDSSSTETKPEIKTVVEDKSVRAPMIVAQEKSDNKNSKKKTSQEKQGNIKYNKADVFQDNGQTVPTNQTENVHSDNSQTVPVDQNENKVITNKSSSKTLDTNSDITVQNDKKDHEERFIVQNVTNETQSTLEHANIKEGTPHQREGKGQTVPKNQTENVHSDNSQTVPVDQKENKLITNKSSSKTLETNSDITVQNDKKDHEERFIVQNVTNGTQSTLEHANIKEGTPHKREGKESNKDTATKIDNNKKAKFDVESSQPVACLIVNSDDTKTIEHDTNNKMQKDKNNNRTQQKYSKNSTSKESDPTVKAVRQSSKQTKTSKQKDQKDTKPKVIWTDNGNETEIKAAFLSIDNTFDSNSVEGKDGVIEKPKTRDTENQNNSKTQNDNVDPTVNRVVQNSEYNKNSKDDLAPKLNVHGTLNEPHDESRRQTDINSQEPNKNGIEREKKEHESKNSDKKPIQFGGLFIEKEDSVTNSNFKKTNYSTNQTKQKQSINSVDERSIFTISNGSVSSIDKQNTAKSIPPMSAMFSQPRSDTFYRSDESKQNKLQRQNYDEKLQTLMSIYHSHSNNGQNDKTLSRTRTQPQLEMPKQQPSSRINPWFAQSKEDSAEVKSNKQVTSRINPWLTPTKEDSPDVKSNKQVTKATVMRRMRTMGVQEFDEENIPQLIPKTNVLNILRSRTTLCDEEIIAPRKRVLPPLKGVPKQELPELPLMWRP